MGKAKRLSETVVIVLGSKIAKQDFRSMDQRMDPFFRHLWKQVKFNTCAF